MDRSDPAYRGQADYSPLLLSVYDRLVLGPIARFVWRCPTPRLLERYRQHIRAPHLDVGPGTGYFVARSTLPAGSAVTIVDPNPNVLAHTSQRLRGFDVIVVQADALKPLPVAGPYESAAMHLVLHCLPGPLSRKALAVANIASVMSPTGVFFGASVLGRSGSHTWLARRVLSAFNWRGAFDNLNDSVGGLRSILEQSFERVEIDVVGSMAVFTATRPREASESAP